MLLSQQVLCVVSSLPIFTAALPASTKPKDQRFLPPRMVPSVNHSVVVTMESHGFD